MKNRLLTYCDDHILNTAELPLSNDLEDDLKKLLMVEKGDKISSLEFLRINLNIGDYNTMFSDCLSTNPIIDACENWLTTWRNDAIQTQPTWRKNTELYSLIRNNNEINGYIKKINNIIFLSYDDLKYTPEEALKLEKQRIISQDASTYINSMERPDLITEVNEEGLVVIKK